MKFYVATFAIFACLCALNGIQASSYGNSGYGGSYGNYGFNKGYSGYGQGHSGFGHGGHGGYSGYGLKGYSGYGKKGGFVEETIMMAPQQVPIVGGPVGGIDTGLGSGLLGGNGNELLLLLFIVPFLLSSINRN